jgi:hypothetical protein
MPSGGNAPREVFLSHSSLDRDFATPLARDLRRHGIPVWFSRTNIVGAQQWHDEIGAALSRCDWFVLVLSPAAVKSRWVKQELLYALNDPRYEDHIVPLVYQACHHKRLSWTLGSCEMVDFSGKYRSACRELLRVWGIGYKT